ncbi:MAG: PIG-L family deacetylase [Actinomycetota bacterium]
MANLVFFHAHPDDEAISTGGTMALMADAGHRVILVCATRGEMGEPAEGVLEPGELLGDRREAELRHSCDVLGVDALEFLGYKDSGMVGEPSNDDPTCFWQADPDEAAERMAVLLRTYECDVLVGYDPHGVYGHPDHIKVHTVGARAAELAGIDRVFWATANRDLINQAREEGQFGDEDLDDDERVDMDIFGMPESEITHAIDVSAALDRKRASLAAHASQITDESFFLAMDDEQFAQAFGTEWMVDAARHAASHQRVGELQTALLDPAHG